MNQGVTEGAVSVEGRKWRWEDVTAGGITLEDEVLDMEAGGIKGED